MKQYEVVMGLEVHVELATNSKLFCSCSAKFGADANENVCPACAGMPGLLPKANKKAIELGIAAALVTNSQITPLISFDKKNYFYPDLSCGYQITQLFAPICTNGRVEIETSEGKKDITLKQIHIEEDAGKLVHSHGVSLVDYNRCSVPLVEIVSNPDFRSAEEVIAYLEKLRALLSFAGVSDCKMQEGSMRCDVNLSVREKGSDKLGIRTEMKNMNSLSAIERAIEYEAQRHIDAIETGCEELVQETRRWDDAAGMSFSMRSKENATDYRYFPNCDIMPIYVSEEWIESVKASLPESAHVKYARMTEELGISAADAKIITKSKKLSDIFDVLMAHKLAAKDVVSWITTDILSLEVADNKSYDDIEIDCHKLAALMKLVDSKQINRKVAKDILQLVYKDGVDPVAYVKENNLGMVSDTGLIEGIIAELLAENPASVAEYKNGNAKVVTFFFGRAMKKTAGKADPAVIREILTKALDEA